MNGRVRMIGAGVLGVALAVGVGACGGEKEQASAGYQPVPAPDASWPSNAAEAYVRIFNTFDSDELIASLTATPNGDFDALATELGAYRDQVVQLMTASQIGSCDWAVHDRGKTEGQVVYSAEVRAGTVLLLADAQLKLHDGACEAAADRLAAGVRYVRHAAETDEMLGKLLADAQFAMFNKAIRELVPEQPGWTDAASSMVLTELRKLDPDDPLAFGAVSRGGSDGETDSLRQYAADQLQESIDVLRRAG